MSVYEYLQLQPLEPQEDGTISDLDKFEIDETIDLTEEAEGTEIIQAWDRLSKDMHENS